MKTVICAAILMAVAAYAGYSYGTKHPTAGDCVNSVFGG